MPYYLVTFTLGRKYFDAAPDVRAALTAREIAYGKELFKVGIWKHAYTTPGELKTLSWAVYETANEAELDRYLAGYPMKQADWYSSVTHQVEIVDPPWYVALLFNVLRLLGFFRPRMPQLAPPA
jgi:muconolactone delta-isomerase